VRYRLASALLRACAPFQRDPEARQGLLTLAREVRGLSSPSPERPPVQSDR
jgi:hypothetical protein